MPQGRSSDALTRALAEARLRIALPGADVEEQVVVGEMRSVVDVDQAFRIEAAGPQADALFDQVAGGLSESVARRVVTEIVGSP